MVSLAASHFTNPNASDLAQIFDNHYTVLYSSTFTTMQIEMYVPIPNTPNNGTDGDPYELGKILIVTTTDLSRQWLLSYVFDVGPDHITHLNNTSTLHYPRSSLNLLIPMLDRFVTDAKIQIQKPVINGITCVAQDVCVEPNVSSSSMYLLEHVLEYPTHRIHTKVDIDCTIIGTTSLRKLFKGVSYSLRRVDLVPLYYKQYEISTVPPSIYESLASTTVEQTHQLISIIFCGLFGCHYHACYKSYDLGNWHTLSDAQTAIKIAYIHKLCSFKSISVWLDSKK
jgi:hypothetical protein